MLLHSSAAGDIIVRQEITLNSHNSSFSQNACNKNILHQVPWFHFCMLSSQRFQIAQKWKVKLHSMHLLLMGIYAGLG